jgi:NADH:ubiquinone oxidoreductase subunit 6 (subunit J)
VAKAALLGPDLLLALAVFHWPGALLLLTTLAVTALPWRRTLPGRVALATGLGGGVLLAALVIDLSR